MGLFEHWTYTNFHNLNLDWIISKVRNIDDNVSAAQTSADSAAESAEAAAGYAAEAAESAEAAVTIPEALEQLALTNARLDNLIVDGQQTEGNTELIDIRVGYNGTTYQTAGDAVRTQASDLNSSQPTLNQQTATALEAGTDLDTLLTYGSFKITTTEIGASLVNKPSEFSTVGRLFVMTAQANARRVQILLEAQQVPRIWLRYHNGSRWFDWVTMLENKNDWLTLNYANATASTADVDTITTPGNYIITSANANVPDGFAQGRLAVLSPHQAHRIIQICMNAESDNSRVWMRYNNGSHWDTWIEFADNKHLEELTDGRLTDVKWIINTLNNGYPVEPNNAFYNQRILSDYVFVGKGTTVNTIETGYDYYVASYDLQKVYQGYIHEGWQNVTPLTVPEDCFIRIIVRKHDDSVVEESEINDLVAKVKMKYIAPTFYTYEETLNDIPSYYDAQLSAAVSSIRANMNACGKNGDTFIFITDPHWDPRVLYRTRNARRSPALVKKIIDETGLKKIIFGGDYFTGNDSAEFEFEQLHDFFTAFNIKNTLVYPIMGNHDWNGYNTSTGEWDNNTAYAQIMKQCEDYVNMGDDLCYFFDNAAAQTRYIMLNSHDQNDTVPAAQLTWLTNTLNSTPSGYRIIVAMHVWFNTVNNAPAASTQNSQVSAICDAFNTDNADRKVRLMIGGHIHYDYVSATPGGIPIIITDTDAYLSAVGSSPEKDTADEQCFDVVTVDYTNNVAKCVRIGRGSNRNINLA